MTIARPKLGRALLRTGNPLASASVTPSFLNTYTRWNVTICGEMLRRPERPPARCAWLRFRLRAIMPRPGCQWPPRSQPTTPARSAISLSAPLPRSGDVGPRPPTGRMSPNPAVTAGRPDTCVQRRYRCPTAPLFAGRDARVHYPLIADVKNIWSAKRHGNVKNPPAPHRPGISERPRSKARDRSLRMGFTGLHRVQGCLRRRLLGRGGVWSALANKVSASCLPPFPARRLYLLVR
jgi:hypothetical protein